MPRINYIVGREDKYLINEFQTHEINGERFEVEDNWEVDKTKS